jgi:hypothetical protein
MDDRSRCERLHKMLKSMMHTTKGKEMNIGLAYDVSMTTELLTVTHPSILPDKLSRLVSEGSPLTPTPYPPLENNITIWDLKKGREYTLSDIEMEALYHHTRVLDLKFDKIARESERVLHCIAARRRLTVTCGV